MDNGEIRKIQYVSDLHLEFNTNAAYIEHNPLEVAGDVLLIAGDTAYLDSPKSKHDYYSKHEFWDWASENYKQVVVCFGNHDFYGYYDLSEMKDGYVKQIRPNVAAYYNAVVPLGNIDVVVSTLWAHIPPENAYITEHSVNDFYRIMYGGHRLNAENFNAEHEKCVKFIENAVKGSAAKTKIVLTHHVPTEQCTADEFKGSTINGAFTTELSDMIAELGADWWVYGHSHRNINATIGCTKIVSNQLGYVGYGEHAKNGFLRNAVMEV